MSARDDDGLTFVELIMYIFISTLFLGLLALMFVNGIRANAQTADRDIATGRASVISDSVLSSIRNSLEFTVSPDGRGLVALVASGDDGWQCRAWALDGDELRYRATAGPIDATDTASWGVLTTGAAGTLIDGGVFEDLGGRGLSIGLAVAGEESTVIIGNGVTAQVVTDEVSVPACW